MVKAVIPFILTFFSGGLAGAVFTWWVNLPITTTLAYSLNTSVIGGEPRSPAASDLKIKMRGQDVGSLYVHAFVFSVPKGGYIDEAEIAIIFPGMNKGTRRSFSITTEKSSPLHKLSCAQIDTGARCTLGPIALQHSPIFRITIATEESSPPTAMTVAKGLSVVPIAEFLSAEERRWMRPEYLVPFSAFAVLALVVMSLVGRRKSRSE